MLSFQAFALYGVTAELRVPTHKGEGTRATRRLIGLGRPQREFLGVRCRSFLAVLGPMRLGQSCLFKPMLCMGVTAELRVHTHNGRVPGPPWCDWAGETPA